MILYLITNGRYYKIGITSKDVYTRIKQLQTGSPHKLKVVKTVKYEHDKHAIFVERYLHEKYRFCRMNGEWFDFKKRKVNINSVIHKMLVFADKNVHEEYKELKHQFHEIRPQNIKRIKRNKGYYNKKKELEKEVKDLFTKRRKFNKNKGK